MDCGEIGYSPERRLLALFPVTNKISYHLFEIQYDNPSVMTLLRKSKWLFRGYYCKDECYWMPEKSIQIDTTNPITSLDFDPQGKYIATADSSGGCLVSAVETNEPTALLKESLDFISATSIQPMSEDSRF